MSKIMTEARAREILDRQLGALRVNAVGFSGADTVESNAWLIAAALQVSIATLIVAQARHAAGEDVKTHVLTPGISQLAAELAHIVAELKKMGDHDAAIADQFGSGFKQ